MSTLTLLSDLVLHCNRCKKLVKTNEYTRHLSSNCELFSTSPELTIQGDSEGRPDDAGLHSSYSDGEHLV